MTKILKTTLKFAVCFLLALLSVFFISAYLSDMAKPDPNKPETYIHMIEPRDNIIAADHMGNFYELEYLNSDRGHDKPAYIVRFIDRDCMRKKVAYTNDVESFYNMVMKDYPTDDNPGEEDDN